MYSFQYILGRILQMKFKTTRTGDSFPAFLKVCYSMKCRIPLNYQGILASLVVFFIFLDQEEITNNLLTTDYLHIAVGEVNLIRTLFLADDIEETKCNMDTVECLP